MIQSKISAGQPEQVTNNEQKADNQHVSPSSANAVLPAVFYLKWIPVKDRLPEIPKDAPSYSQYVKVLGAWDKHWAEFYYVRKMVRGQIVERFEWNGRINTFPITHWAIPVCP